MKSVLDINVLLTNFQQSPLISLLHICKLKAEMVKDISDLFIEDFVM